MKTAANAVLYGTYMLRLTDSVKYGISDMPGASLGWNKVLETVVIVA